jgi:hypothetical protein
MLPKQIMPTTTGPTNDLIFAINHYFATGDRIGEGVLFESDSHWLVSLPVHPGRPLDVEDFEKLKGRLTEIETEQGWTLPIEAAGTAPGGFRISTLTVPKSSTRQLAIALLQRPSLLGWGSPKAEMDRAWTTIATQLQIARLEGVWLASIESATAREVRNALTGRLDPVVLDLALQPTGEDGRPARWWRVPARDEEGYAFYLDDPTFGPPANLADLAYNPEIGLHVAKHARGEK